jgi:threonylcarbamoyladenosine tRNA methylthiotransferase MtaB
MNKRKVFVRTFGCKVNQYESQALAEKMIRSGMELCGSVLEADVVLVNSCTVTAEADRECRQFIRKTSKNRPGAEIILTGCYVTRAAEELRHLFPGVNIQEDKGRRGPIESFHSHSRAFVMIQDGCDAFCSYCIVPHVRPKLWSRPEQEILEEAARLAANGYAEIVLTGIRLGKYNGGGGLPGLLEKLMAAGDNFRIRLSSLEYSEVSDELLGLMSLRGGRVCRHLHIPLQSGSDRVLSLMKRPYTVDKFSALLKKIHAALPDAGVSTDVITGFPGESEKDFENTYDFLKNSGFSRLHVFKYSEREGTPAASYNDKVSPEAAGARAKALKALDGELQKNFWRRFIGKELQVVKEGNNASLMTGNYIRLDAGPGFEGVKAPFFGALIAEKNGRPAGLLPPR